MLLWKGCKTLVLSSSTPPHLPPTICDSADMLTHASQILLSHWHPSYVMTTAVRRWGASPAGPSDLLLSKPQRVERMCLPEVPPQKKKISALIKMYRSPSRGAVCGSGGGPGESVSDGGEREGLKCSTRHVFGI